MKRRLEENLAELKDIAFSLIFTEDEGANARHEAGADAIAAITRLDSFMVDKIDYWRRVEYVVLYSTQ